MAHLCTIQLRPKTETTSSPFKTKAASRSRERACARFGRVYSKRRQNWGKLICELNGLCNSKMKYVFLREAELEAWRGKEKGKKRLNEEYRKSSIRSLRDNPRRRDRHRYTCNITKYKIILQNKYSNCYNFAKRNDTTINLESFYSPKPLLLKFYSVLFVHFILF